MANHRLNHLTFYGIAIGSVLALFKFVSTYGETQIKAPVNVNGVYELQSNNLPSCLAGQPLELDIEQSGVYLFGHLALNSDTAPKKIPLSGDLEGNKVVMKGDLESICPEVKDPEVILKGEITDKTIVGALEAQALQGNFSGTKKILPEKETGGH
jgi:hypothetical protein